MPFFAYPWNARLFGRLAVIDVVFGFWRVDLRKERLVVLQLSPVVGVVQRPLVDKIQVKLAVPTVLSPIMLMFAVK